MQFFNKLCVILAVMLWFFFKYAVLAENKSCFIRSFALSLRMIKTNI